MLFATLKLLIFYYFASCKIILNFIFMVRLISYYILFMNSINNIIKCIAYFVIN